MKVVHQGRRKRAARPQLAVESLERRTLLSGNVLATQSGDRLDLVGDELGNEIMIRSGKTPTEVIVQSMDQTTVNGSQQPVVFEGVTSLFVTMGGGDDWFKAADLTLQSAGNNSNQVDGGWGDDRIEFKNTTIKGGVGGGVGVYGDLSLFEPDPQPNTGNDTIEFANTTFVAEGPDAAGAGLDIYGEFTTGGEITGGNDTIRITDTVINVAGGSDFENSVITIRGDYIFAFDSDATIGGGNDSISVRNTKLNVEGGRVGVAVVEIEGDHDVLADGPFAGLIGGGNDSIVVDNLDATASGGPSGAAAFLRVTGDITENQSQSPLSRAEIGGGNDDITVSNALFGAADAPESLAIIQIVGESQPVFGGGPSPGTSLIGQGNDRVTLRNVTASADFSAVTIDTALGDDTLDVLNSSFGEFNASLGDGNDYAKFDNNLFESAHLDGGPRFDVLGAHNNDGLLTFSNFERVNVT